MNRMSYEKQIKVCMIILVVSIVLTVLFRTRLFFKIGVMIYGLLFLVNPVLPKKAKVTPHSTIAVRILGGILLLIGATGRL